jgi:hypothetical protein
MSTRSAVFNQVASGFTDAAEWWSELGGRAEETTGAAQVARDGAASCQIAADVLRRLAILQDTPIDPGVPGSDGPYNTGRRAVMAALGLVMQLWTDVGCAEGEQFSSSQSNPRDALTVTADALSGALAAFGTNQ